jgi:hypothetical protein
VNPSSAGLKNYSGASLEKSRPVCCSTTKHSFLLARQRVRTSYDVSMDSRKLTPSQVAHLRDVIARQLRFAGKLCARMESLGFPPSDPLFAAALRSRHALQELHVVAHYCGCTGGVGR